MRLLSFYFYNFAATMKQDFIEILQRNLCIKQSVTCLRLSLLLALLIAGSLAVKAQDSLNVKPFQTGLATYYSAKSHGRKMSSGKTYSKAGFTCAHRTLPFGTMVKVVNTKNGKSTVVEVADRGPFARGRVIDLSNSAAAELDMLWAGVVSVELYIVNDSTIKQP